MVKRPPTGLCVPVETAHIRDGDTVVVRLPGSIHQWAIRLIDCWCHELHEPGGPAASEHLGQLLRDRKLYLQIPCPAQTTNLLRNLTFDRVPGYIWITETETINERMIADGYAYRTKAEQKQAAEAGI